MTDHDPGHSPPRTRESVLAERSRGVGDTIAKYMPPVIKKVAELYTEVTGNDCGCQKRQDALNEMFPYGEK